MFDTDVKVSPITQYFETLGYKYDFINGKKLIKVFTSQEEELNTLYKGVGLRDISGSGILELSGKDSLDFLHRISTNKLKDLLPESTAKTIFTNEKGRFIDAAVVMNFGDHQILISSSEHKQKITNWISRYIISDDVNMNAPENKYVLFELLGPQADSFITLVCGNMVNEIEENKFKAVKSDGIIFFLIKMRDKAGHLKFLILADPENGLNLVKYMVNNKGPFDFNLIGEDAYNCYRIFTGIPSAPNEINTDYNPHEAGLLDFVSFSKGCYIGQEVIARLDTYDKVQKFLRGITFSEPAEQNGLYDLFDGQGNEAGKITSTCYSEKNKQNIGLAYVKKSFQEDGTELFAKDANGKNIKVTVKSFPFKK